MATTQALAPDQAARDFMPLNGIDHVELWVGNAAQAAHFFAHAYGFTRVAYRGLETGVRDQVSHVLRQGRIQLVLTSSLCSRTEITRHHARHGDGVKVIALSVPDVDAAYREATGRGAEGALEPYEISDAGGAVRLAEIRTYGETIHRFVERGRYEGLFLPGFAATPPRPESQGREPRLLTIDHIVGNVELGQMDRWVKFYEDVFGMTEMIHFSDEAISTEYSALMSKVVTSGDGRVKFPINEPAEGRRKSQIDEYLEFYEGAGPQHIALATRDIVGTVAELQGRGVQFLQTPESYYGDVPERVGEIDESLEDLRRLGILVDRDDEGYLLQIFTKPLGDRPTIFFEIIERHGARGFGEGNFKALFEAIEREQDRRGESLMRYAAVGELPAKRHVQFRRDGRLLVEEVMGYEGFSGNESILYHRHSPCRVQTVGSFHPFAREEWAPDAYVHRLTDIDPLPAGGDPLSARRLLMFNRDLEVSVAKPTEATDRFYRNGEGDEVIYVHRGRGVLCTIFGRVPFRERDYVVIPRGTTHTWELDEGIEHVWLCFHTPGEIETPHRYRNRYGQLLEHAPFSQRDFHGPLELESYNESGEFQLVVRVRGGLQELVLDRHPFDVVGWDGYVWPYTFNADDFEPRAGRLHLPPPTHQTFQGPNFVICTFAPRMLDWDPDAVPLPYHHSNIQSEEVMFYAAGDYAARKGVSAGCLTLHPSGVPHGPQPGAVERALGATRTDELAIMWDTFSPLLLTPLWREHDDPGYAYSWNPDHSGAPVAG